MGPKEVKKHAREYVAAAQNNIVLVAAARAWKQGVPWSEAYGLCENAIRKASEKLDLKPIPKRKGKGKGKGRK